MRAKLARPKPITIRPSGFQLDHSDAEAIEKLSDDIERYLRGKQPSMHLIVAALANLLVRYRTLSMPIAETWMLDELILRALNSYKRDTAKRKP